MEEPEEGEDGFDQVGFDETNWAQRLLSRFSDSRNFLLGRRWWGKIQRFSPDGPAEVY
jgi:hypothetical protein